LTSIRPSLSPKSHDAHVYRRALGVGSAGLLGALVLMGSRIEIANPRASLHHLGGLHLSLSPKMVAASEPEHLTAEPLTEELRQKGFNECNPHDPIGLGPYRPYRNVALGRLLVPQKGGHTADGGYDVVLHFHGHEAIRKTLVQVARGVAYVGMDRGLGSGAYEQTFACPDVFPALRASIENGLKAESGDPNAHIRHLALTAWSAGYGAVNEILKRFADQVDAVVLLDGLHGSWDATPNRDPAKPLRGTSIAPTIEFARRAVHGEKLFIFTHSQIDPVEYPSTSATADSLLVEFGLKRQSVERGSYAFGQDTRVDTAGFHVWSYRGKNELAHCAHIPLMARALEIVERAWQTPAMDRNVPLTPVKHWPKLNSAVESDPGGRPAAQEPESSLEKESEFAPEKELEALPEAETE
jgi:hypothetical protein